jgi:hypothetical protein
MCNTVLLDAKFDAFLLRIDEDRPLRPERAAAVGAASEPERVVQDERKV